MSRHRRRYALVALLPALTALFSIGGASPVQAQQSLLVKLVENGVRHVGTANGSKALPDVSGSMVEMVQAAVKANKQAAAIAAEPTAGTSGGGSTANIGISASSLGCAQRNPDGNVRVNQDCTYRRQAEAIIKYNPADPSNLVAGQNDSRIGYNHCGIDYSLNSGRSWGDQLPPFWQKENHPELMSAPVPGDMNDHSVSGGTPAGTDRTYDFASDPILAVDSQGRAFFGCVVISLAANEGDNPSDNATGLLVSTSPAVAKGSFYDNVSAHSRRFVVAEDNSPTVFHDKPFITADFYKNSPNRDNVYATWTVFRDPANCAGDPADNTQGCSPIFGSMSTDSGQHWSTPELISGSAAYCAGVVTGITPSPCNQDQGSDPIVLPDGKGSLVVAFNNTNTKGTFVNQQLAVRCAPSGSSPAGTAHLNCGAPSHVGKDDQTGEPLCNFGRGPEECIPGNYVRTNDFPRIAVNRDNGHVFVTWQDYRTGRFDIQLSESTDGGVTWNEAAAPVTPDAGKDHYFPAIDTVSSPQGNGDLGRGRDRVGISYHRTDRVSNENTTPAGGFAPCPGTPCQADVATKMTDYTLAGGSALHTPYAFRRISPETPPPDGAQAGFLGDYTGLTIVNTTAHPVWADTRNASPFGPTSVDYPGVTRDEDVFTDAVPVPSGDGGDNQNG